MTSDQAALIAQAAHGSQLDRDGSLHFEHVERVAQMVPEVWRAIAYLHDVLEDTDFNRQRIRRLLTGIEWDALLLLSRLNKSGKRLTYNQYIQRIADDRTEAGVIARSVKEADLLDNLSRCLRAGDDAARRYRRALPVIQGAMMASRAQARTA